MAGKQKMEAVTNTDDLINPADVTPDQHFENPDYDKGNDKVDPETREHEVDMGPDPGEDAK